MSAPAAPTPAAPTGFPWKPVIWVAAIIAAVVIGKIALDAHDANLIASAQNAVLQKTVKDQADAISQSKADQKQIADNLQAQLNAIAKQRTVVITPQQAAQQIRAIVPNLPQPVTVVPQKDTSDPTKDTQALLIPQADIPAFQNYKLDCDEKGAKLDACTLNQAQAQIQFDAQKKIADDYQQEAATWKKAARGSIWHRLGNCGVKVGVGAGSGGAFGGSKGAAVGAAIGAGSCLLFK